MKRLADILEIVLLVIMIGLCIVVLMAGSGRVPYVFGYRVLQVVSDSMKPTISDETCIVIRKVKDINDIKVGDIVTFMSEDPTIEGFYNTHRVHDIVTDAETGEILLQTKGDKYEEPDALLVSYDQIAGRYVGELPYGEYLYRGILFLMDRVNYFIIVIAPLFLCLMSYIKQLIMAIFGKSEDDDEEDEDEEDKIETSAKKLAKWERIAKQEKEKEQQKEVSNNKKKKRFLFGKKKEKQSEEENKVSQETIIIEDVFGIEDLAEIENEKEELAATEDFVKSTDKKSMVTEIKVEQEFDYAEKEETIDIQKNDTVTEVMIEMTAKEDRIAEETQQ